jgi:arsenate reductase
MAEGIVNHDLGDIFEAFSAGTEATSVNTKAIEVMLEIGIDLSGHRSKIMDEFVGEEFDFVITLCGDALEKCPLFFGGVQRIHMGVTDPSRMIGSDVEVMQEFRHVRDELRQKLVQFLERH